MHSALFVATIQLPSSRGGQPWFFFSQEISSHVSPSENVQRLAENVWLINVSVSPAPLGFLIAAAERNSISYGIIPFRRQPEWLPAGFDLGTIQDQNAS